MDYPPLPSHHQTEAIILQIVRQSTDVDILQREVEEEVLRYIDEREREEIEERDALFTRLTENFTCELGKTISKQERHEKRLNSNSLTYGEIEFKAIAQVFQAMRKRFGCFQESGGTFIDIGSGTGKGVLAGALMHPFAKCIGVEILDSLYSKSLELKEVYDKHMEQTLQQNAPTFEVHKGDLLQHDWHSQADFVLANSTCFDLPLMKQIAQKASLMKVGTWMITLTKKLPSADPLFTRNPEDRDWECVMSIKMVMSWGYATVNVQRKIK